MKFNTIEQAKNIGGDANYYVKDMMLENWGSTQYDVVIDFGYFHFFAPELRSHYHEQLKSVLKSGGIYINESGRYKKWKSQTSRGSVQCNRKLTER